MRNINYLIYLIENCIKDLEVLKRINSTLVDSMKLSSGVDVNYLGVIDRCIKGYLIIKIASLFDKHNKTISLYSILDNKINNFKNISIIKQIIRTRNKFIAHNDFRYLENNNFGLQTNIIIVSDLNKILQELLEEAKRKVEELIEKRD